MGYILPIEHYQYNDYHRRVVQDKVNKHFIERPFKAILEREHQEISTQYNALNNVPYQSVQSRTSAEKIFGELTGKGSLFSDQV